MIGRWVSTIGHDRMCLVVIFSRMEPYWKRPDAGVLCSVTLSSVSGHYLNVLMTVDIERSAFDADDTWQASGDRTLGPASGRTNRSIRSPRVVPSEGVQRLYFVGASI